MNIKCRICNKEMGIKSIGVHLKTHSTKFDEYVGLYLDDFPNHYKCNICGKITKNKQVCSIECERKFMSNKYSNGNNPMFGKTMSNEMKESLSIRAKERFKDKTNHPRYGTHFSEDSKLKLRVTQRERFKDKTNHPMYGKTQTTESKNRISEKMKIAMLGENNPMFGKTHTPEAIKKIFKHRKMNKLEKKVADWLDSHNIKYTFQFFINSNGVCKSYDFKLKDSDIIIEVHGDYWHGGVGVKKHVFNVDNVIKNDTLKTDMAKEAGYKVISVWEHQINDDIDILQKILN